MTSFILKFEISSSYLSGSFIVLSTTDRVYHSYGQHEKETRTVTLASLPGMRMYFLKIFNKPTLFCLATFFPHPPYFKTGYTQNTAVFDKTVYHGISVLSHA